MSNYITLELDTTEPILEIYSPSYTIREVDVEVSITSNESLDNWQETYLIDENGIRHDYNFHIEGNQIVGLLNFNGFPLGLARLYIRVRDEVHNISSVYSKIITIRNSISLLKLNILDFNRKIEIADTSLILDVLDFKQEMKIEDTAREMKMKDSNRKTSSNEQKRLSQGGK